MIYIDVCRCKENNMTREEAADICKALSDSNRLRIVEMLTISELCACELNGELNITQPTLSHHMKILGACQLVSAKKDGKWMHYSLNCPRFREFKEFIGSLEYVCEPSDNIDSDKSCDKINCGCNKANGGNS